MKKLAAILVAMSIAAPLMVFSSSASACGTCRQYVKPYYGCAYKRVYTPCRAAVPGCCQHECLYYRAMVPCKLF